MVFCSSFMTYSHVFFPAHYVNGCKAGKAFVLAATPMLLMKAAAEGAGPYTGARPAGQQHSAGFAEATPGYSHLLVTMIPLPRRNSANRN